MAELFDIQFVTMSFGTCNLGHYLGLIASASSKELCNFRRQVKSHEKKSNPSGAFANTPWLTAHGAIVAAINYELLKRSPMRHKIWSFILPIRQFLVAKFSGMKLERNEHFGAIYTWPTYRRSVWHMSHREIAIQCWRFIVHHQKAIVASVLTVITALVIRWLAL